MLTKKLRNPLPESHHISRELYMGHLDLNDKAFHEWAVKKLVEETRIEELEDFCTRYPPDELKHIFSVLDAKVIPLLHSEGIPITKPQCFKLFQIWFIRMTIATQNATPEDNTQQGNTTSFWVGHWLHTCPECLSRCSPCLPCSSRRAWSHRACGVSATQRRGRPQRLRA